MKRILKYQLIGLSLWVLGCKTNHQPTEGIDIVVQSDSLKKAVINQFGSIFPGGKTLVFGSMDEIWISQVLASSAWSEPKKIRGAINTEFIESNPAISPDGEYLYFSSNRDGGFGGFDIYVAERNENNEWINITNLGPVVNTHLDEDMPYLSKDGERFYYNSKSHKSIGGFDVFMSEIKGVGFTISKPMSDINSTSDDLLYPYFLNEGFAVKMDSVPNTKNLIIVNMSFAEIQPNNIAIISEELDKNELIKEYLKGDIGYNKLLKVFGDTKIDEVHYEMQIGASSGAMEFNENIKRAGKIVIREVSDSLKRYSLGIYETLNEIEKVKLLLEKETYADAFLVCYINGEKSELHKLLKEYIEKNEVGTKE